MNNNKTMIALAFVMLAIVPVSMVLMSDGSDADLTIEDGMHGEGFATNSDGTLFVPIFNTEDLPKTITLTVIIDDNDERTFPNVEVPANGGDIELRFRIGGAGEHTIKVIGKPADPSDRFFPIDNNDGTVNVKQSIMDKPATYIAIAVVVILIVIAFYMHTRNAPAKKPEITFTELEERKRASRGETKSTPNVSATERRRYNKASASEPSDATPKKKGNAPEEKAAPAPVEKKASTFTELEREKAAEKESKKDQSSEEPKKLKYVSSRRK